MGKLRAVIAAACLLGGIAAACGAASSLAAPRAAAHRPVQLVARGLQTTTAFAFGDGKVFVAEEPTSGEGVSGVFVLGHGGGTRVYTGAPFGLAWHRGALYVADGPDLVRLSGWNGARFATATTIYSGSARFTGFNGIGFGADGRLYAGVYLGSNDHSPTGTPYAFDVLSLNMHGGDLRIVARGLREPWQMAFPAGSSSPYVSVFGQDRPEGIEVPDFLARVRTGQNYGFPACNWVSPARCRHYAKPARLFPPHSDVGGLAIVGHRLFASEFGYAAPQHPPRVVEIPLGRAGAVRTVATGFPHPIIGLGASHGYLYVGDLVGNVYRTPY